MRVPPRLVHKCKTPERKYGVGRQDVAFGFFVPVEARQKPERIVAEVASSIIIVTTLLDNMLVS
jgi:hypothetical protein